MAGLLESIGRAKPVTQIRQGLMEFEEQQREQRVFEFEERQRVEQERIGNIPIPIDDMFTTGVTLPTGGTLKLNSTPGQRSILENLVSSEGFTTEVEGHKVIPFKYLPAIQQIMGARTELAQQLATAGIMDLDKSISAIEQKINSGEIKGKDLQQAQQMILQQKQQRQGMLDSRLRLDEQAQREIAVAGAKAGMKEPKRAWKVVPDEASSTGFSYQDLETGDIGAEAPKPSALVNIEMGKPASAAERTAIATGAATIDSLNNLKSLFDESYVGPIRGRVSTVKEIFGGNPQKQSEFIAATAAFKNQIIKEITGAAMSVEEAERIMTQVPDINNPPSVWQARWNQSVENLKRIQKRRAEVLRKSGIRTPDVGITEGNLPQTAEEYLNSIGR